MLVDLVVDRFVTGRPSASAARRRCSSCASTARQLIPGGGANAVAGVRALGGRPCRWARWATTPRVTACWRSSTERGISTTRNPGAQRLPHAHQDAHPGRRPPRHQAAGGALRRGGRAGDAAKRSTRELAGAGARGRGRVGAVLSDYGYGAVRSGLLPQVRELAGRASDSRRQPLPPDRLRGPRRRHPNLEEAEQASAERCAIDDRRRSTPRDASCWSASAALAAGHPRQRRHVALHEDEPRRSALYRCTAPTRWPTSPAPATP